MANGPKRRFREREQTMAKQECKRKPAYTPLTTARIGEVMDRATGELFGDADLAKDVAESYEVEEHDSAPGTYFVQYRAWMWGDADAFQNAVIGAAQAEGLFAEATTTWRDGIVGREKDGRRLVSVFVSAVDYADEASRNAA